MRFYDPIIRIAQKFLSSDKKEYYKLRNELIHNDDKIHIILDPLNRLL